MVRIIVRRKLTLRGWRWFWKAVAPNNRSIAIGGEGYHNRGDILAIIETIKREMMLAEVHVEG